MSPIATAQHDADEMLGGDAPQASNFGEGCARGAWSNVIRPDPYAHPRVQQSLDTGDDRAIAAALAEHGAPDSPRVLAPVSGVLTIRMRHDEEDREWLASLADFRIRMRSADPDVAVRAAKARALVECARRVEEGIPVPASVDALFSVVGGPPTMREDVAPLALLGEEGASAR